jgi:hypothetical protein
MISCSCFYRLGAEYFVHFISALRSQTGQVVDNLSAPAVQGCRANPCPVTVLPSTITRPNLSEISTTHRTTCCRSFTFKPYPTHKMQVTSSNKCAHHYRCLKFVSPCTHVKTTDYVNTATIGDGVPKRNHRNTEFETTCARKCAIGYCRCPYITNEQTSVRMNAQTMVGNLESRLGCFDVPQAPQPFHSSRPFAISIHCFFSRSPHNVVYGSLFSA